MRTLSVIVRKNIHKKFVEQCQAQGRSSSEVLRAFATAYANGRIAVESIIVSQEEKPHEKD